MSTRSLRLLLLPLLLSAACGGPPASSGEERPDGSAAPQPVNVRATATASGAEVSWEDAGAGAQGYIVRALPGTVALQVEGTARSARVTGLVPGRRYRFRVVPVVGGVERAASAPSAEVLAGAAPAEVVALQLPAGPLGGCVSIHYALHQPQGLPVDVVVEYDAFGTGEFRRATPASSAEHAGVQGVRTSTRAEGSAHGFLWNSTADLPSVSTEQLRLRVSTRAFGTVGAARVLEGLSLQNAARYAPQVQLESGAAPGLALHATADLDLDGHPDVVAVDAAGSALTVLWGGATGFEAGAVALPAGARPAAVGSADVDRDGRPDLLIADASAGALLLLPGRGARVFAAALAHPAVAQPSSLAVADLTHDGVPDVALSSASTTEVAVLVGQRTGTFAAPLLLPAGAPQTAVVLADVDRNGGLDLVLSRPSRSALGLLLADGAGGFGPVQDVEVGAAAHSVAAGDFNRDGHVDLAAAHAAGGLSVVLAQRGGGFGAGTGFALGTAVRGLLGVELDGDGQLDLVAQVTDGVQVLRGMGDGSFRPTLALATPSATTGLVVADTNRDGRPDLLTGSAGSAQVGLLRSTRPQRCELRVAGEQDVALDGYGLSGLGDLDEDGKTDAIVTREGMLEVYRGLGAGRFALKGRTLTTGGFTSILTSDMDGDGHLDVLGFYSSSSVSIFPGRGDGTLAPAKNFLLDAIGTPGLADVNADGRDDVVAGGMWANDARPTALLNAGDGTLGAPLRLDPGTSVFAFTTGDFDADGRLDVITSGIDSADRTTQKTLLVRGAWGETSAPPAVVPLTGVYQALAAGDFNRDGHLDLAGVSSDSRTLQWVMGTGEGAFRGGGSLALPEPHESTLLAEDVDGDGHLDLLTSSCLLRGDGEGRFTSAPCESYTSFGPRLADIDGDGRRDLVDHFSWVPAPEVGEGFFRGASTPRWYAAGPVGVGDADRDGDLDLYPGIGPVLRGEGDGTFTSIDPAGLWEQGSQISLWDLDRDGAQDLVVSHGWPETLSVLRGKGDGTFEAAVSSPDSGYGRIVLAGDLNGDGFLDLVTHGSELRVRLGRGDATFAPPMSAPPLGATLFVVLEDLNRDGHLDLFSGTAGVGVEGQLAPLRLRPGRGDGTFGPEQTHPTENLRLLWPLAPGDFDRDGLLDVAVTTGSPHKLALLRGSGTGGFELTEAPSSPTVSNDVGSWMRAVDLDGNGWLDLLPATGGQSFLGQPDGSWREGPASRAWTASLQGPPTADFDRDGLEELYFFDDSVLRRVPLR